MDCKSDAEDISVYLKEGQEEIPCPKDSSVYCFLSILCVASFP